MIAYSYGKIILDSCLTSLTKINLSKVKTQGRRKTLQNFCIPKAVPFPERRKSQVSD